MTTLHSLSSAALREAIAIKEQMEKLGTRLTEIFGGEATAAPSRPRTKMSPQARAKIAAAQKARWAKVKGAAKSAATAANTSAKAPKKKGGLTPQGRAKLAAAMKARWAAKKKAAASSPAK